MLKKITKNRGIASAHAHCNKKLNGETLKLKMAALKRRHGVISKGSKWTVVVEECINDVLIVCLETETKTFRGILLDANKR